MYYQCVYLGLRAVTLLVDPEPVQSGVKCSIVIDL